MNRPRGERERYRTVERVPRQREHIKACICEENESSNRDGARKRDGRIFLAAVLANRRVEAIEGTSAIVFER